MQKFPSPPSWQPSASMVNLRKRAEIIQRIRAFFAAKNVMEVETPVLASATIPAPYMESFITQFIPVGHTDGQNYYLQTSPEFHMKRLLAADSGPIYQITKAFRNGEVGRFHQPEFTMLEWYRPGFDHHQLMTEVDELLQMILTTRPAQRKSYTEIFKQYLAIDPINASSQELQDCAVAQGVEQVVGLALDDKDGWLNVLMSHCIEPHLGLECPMFIYDFPASQAALAQLNPDNPAVAERFEVYVNGVELANGFHELTDAVAQRDRFEHDLICRARENLPPVPFDEYLLAALAAGFPPCAGVALGIDRLCMLALQANHIAQVTTFCFEIA